MKQKRACRVFFDKDFNELVSENLSRILLVKVWSDHTTNSCRIIIVQTLS